MAPPVFPPHRVYVEPFGGAASVLLRKPRSYAEVYNDLDDEVVNLFRVLRSPIRAERLRQRVALTAFARAEFKASYRNTTDPVERARRTIVRAFMGFGSASMNRMHITGFRFNANRSGTTPAQDWASWPEQVPLFVERLRGVVVEQRPAIEVIRQFDGRDTLVYCDPPYVPETRSSLKHKNGNRGHYYRCDMTVADHEHLANALHRLSGMVVLSGYASDLYERLFPHWVRHERVHMADGARRRVEVVWLNPACVSALAQARSQHSLSLTESA